MIIPCFNVAQTIGAILKELNKRPIDVVLIDDGSADATVEIAGCYQAVILKNKGNLGKGLSLRKGFDYALACGYATIITMDGDGQHLPEDVDSFLKAGLVRPEVDIVIGNRMDNPLGMPFIRRLTNRIMSRLLSAIAHQEIPDSQNGFRLIKSRALASLNLESARFEIESEIIIKASLQGAKIISIPVRSVYKNSPSSINPFWDTFRFIKFILPYL